VEKKAHYLIVMHGQKKSCINLNVLRNELSDIKMNSACDTILNISTVVLCTHSQLGMHQNQNFKTISFGFDLVLVLVVLVLLIVLVLMVLVLIWFWF